MPGAQCTRSLVCAYCELSMHTSIHSEAPETPGIPHAMVLRRIRALLGEPGFLAPVIPDGRASQPGWAPHEPHET
jgi:hypothetical protein